MSGCRGVAIGAAPLIRAPMDDPRWNYVAGQVHGLMALMLAVVRSHPNPAGFLREIELAQIAATARTEAEAVDDDFLEGLADALNRVRTLAEERARSLGAGNTRDRIP